MTEQALRDLLTAPIGEFDIEATWDGNRGKIDPGIEAQHAFNNQKTSAGNALFLFLIKEYRPIYLAAVTRDEKHEILKKIYEDLKSHGSGRFLSKRASHTGVDTWYEISRIEALLKIRQWLVAGRETLRQSKAVIANLKHAASSKNNQHFPRAKSPTCVRMV